MRRYDYQEVTTSICEHNVLDKVSLTSYINHCVQYPGSYLPRGRQVRQHASRGTRHSSLAMTRKILWVDTPSFMGWGCSECENDAQQFSSPYDLKPIAPWILVGLLIAKTTLPEMPCAFVDRYTN